MITTAGRVLGDDYKRVITVRALINELHTNPTR
jgi:hypothetical protein